MCTVCGCGPGETRIEGSNYQPATSMSIPAPTAP